MAFLCLFFFIYIFFFFSYSCYSVYSKPHYYPFRLTKNRDATAHQLQKKNQDIYTYNPKLFRVKARVPIVPIPAAEVDRCKKTMNYWQALNGATGIQSKFGSHLSTEAG